VNTGTFKKQDRRRWRLANFTELPTELLLCCISFNRFRRPLL